MGRSPVSSELSLSGCSIKYLAKRPLLRWRSRRCTTSRVRHWGSDGAIHLLHGAVLGVVFAAAVSIGPLRQYADRISTGTVLGLVYGVLTTVVLAGVVLPIWLSVSVSRTHHHSRISPYSVSLATSSTVGSSEHSTLCLVPDSEETTVGVVVRRAPWSC